jgi:hypothetical protein
MWCIFLFKILCLLSPVANTAGWTWGHGKYEWMEGCGNLQKGVYDYAFRRCLCHVGFGNNLDMGINKDPRCTSRLCPSGVSWNDRPHSSDIGHQLAECSNRGLCDAATGECQCFIGYGGPACDRTICPTQDGVSDDCSGHGKCVNIARYGMHESGFPLHNVSTTYERYTYSKQWDGRKLMGCLCDSSWSVGLGNGETQATEWFGPDCSMKRCPSGNDPLTVDDETNCEGKSYNGIMNSSGTRVYFYNTKQIKSDNETVDVQGLYSHIKGYGSVGNKCHIDCSNRGSCDYDTGICSCFKGFTGTSCSEVVKKGSNFDRGKFGFNQQPFASSISSTGFTINLVASLYVTTRCGVYSNHAIVPSATEVLAGLGYGRSQTGEFNGPVVNVLVPDKSLLGDVHQISYSGLTAATQYDVYCATASPHRILSKRLDVITVGFVEQPHMIFVTSSSITITADPATDINIRCAIFANGAVIPTASNVLGGVGTGNAAVGALNGPVVAVLPAGKTTGGDNHIMEYTGLSSMTSYDIYCATADASPYLSQKLEVTTQ